jgi:hypothetical protein
MDLDYLVMRVRVRQNFVLGEFGSPKSRRSSRSLPLDEELAGARERYRKAVAQRLMGKRSHRRSRCLTTAETATGFEGALGLVDEWQPTLSPGELIELGGLPPIDA